MRFNLKNKSFKNKRKKIHKREEEKSGREEITNKENEEREVMNHPQYSRHYKNIGFFQRIITSKNTANASTKVF